MSMKCKLSVIIHMIPTHGRKKDDECSLLHTKLFSWSNEQILNLKKNVRRLGIVQGRLFHSCTDDVRTKQL